VRRKSCAQEKPCTEGPGCEMAVGDR